MISASLIPRQGRGRFFFSLARQSSLTAEEVNGFVELQIA